MSLSDGVGDGREGEPLWRDQVRERVRGLPLSPGELAHGLAQAAGRVALGAGMTAEDVESIFSEAMVFVDDGFAGDKEREK